MIGLYRSMDAALIEWSQVAYLWLLDRTGVYVGTIMLVISAVVTCLHMQQESRSVRPHDIIFLLVISLIAARTYYLQGAGRIEYFNKLTLRWRDDLNRHLFNSVWLACLIYDAAYARRYWMGVCDVLWFCWNYINCALIRDREPPRKEEQELSTEGAR